MTTTAAPVRPEPEPVRAPDRTGQIVRDGVGVAYRLYENPGRPTLLLMPTWSIVHSRIWKAQVPYLSRHYRVITFDGRGNGESDRPVGAAHYADEEFVADAVAVLDATGTDRAVLVGLSMGAHWSLLTVVAHPDRVAGVVAIGSACVWDVDETRRRGTSFERPPDPTDRWRKFNAQYWQRGDYADFLAFFFGEMFPEPHSTKQIEDCIGWGQQISPETLVDTVFGEYGMHGATVHSVRDCAGLTCPVLVIHGTDDRIMPAEQGQRVAELTGGDLVLLEGAGHGPIGRQPVRLNLLIKEFADRVTGPPAVAASETRRRTKTPRVLYLSSPIGLGHARRDLAVAQQLRALRPGVQIDWLAQHPVTRVLADAGETVHPASASLANESRHIEHESGEHDLHAFQAIRRMDELLVANFMVFAVLVAEQRYDLVIGDEAWDVDYHLHENPALKRFPFAWMTDFVGWLPMPDADDRERLLTADYNAEMLEHRARRRAVRERSVFVGSADDIVDETFGPGLPDIRAWTEQNFDFTGYVTGFVPPGEEQRARYRARLGIRDDERLCVVTVGGSGVGGSLLRRVLQAVPAARRREPGLRFLVVTGPRIDPELLDRPDGAQIVGYAPDLTDILAAADIAVVQGGLSTCMELTACRTRFLYVPLRHHFEQNFHVRHRLERYRAGRYVAYDEAAEPDALAGAISTELGCPVDYLPVETDGAARAARLLADLF